MNFGTVALAGAFLKADQLEAEQRHPLTLQFCEKCLLVQTGQSIPPATLFQDYFYFSSATETMRRHFERYAQELVARFRPESVLEIGCNDGVLLRPLQSLGVKRLLGVDPAENVTPKDLPIVNAYWGEKFAATCRERFDMILANNVFAHIEDINGACAAVAKLLNDGGSFVFEVNRLDSMVADLQYDWVYHEHLFYYSLLALDKLLARHGLMVYHLQRIGTHAGSARYYACKAGEQMPTLAVHEQRNRERWHGLHVVKTFQDFERRAVAHRADMQALVHQHGRVAGYGACGRTSTLLQWCGFGPEQIAYIIDDAPAKQGYCMPGTHIQITNLARLEEEPTDCLIVFAWSFLTEIGPKLSRYGGDVIVPLPHIYGRKERRAA